MSQPPAYPLYKLRYVVRCITLLFIFPTFGLLIADAVHCASEPLIPTNDRYEQCWSSPITGDLQPFIYVVIAMVFGPLEVLLMSRKNHNGGTNPVLHLPADLLLFVLLVRSASDGLQALHYIYVDGLFIATRVLMLISGFVQLLTFVLSYHETNILRSVSFTWHSSCLTEQLCTTGTNSAMQKTLPNSKSSLKQFDLRQ
jgi:hypothetical protein